MKIKLIVVATIVLVVGIFMLSLIQGVDGKKKSKGKGKTGGGGKSISGGIKKYKSKNSLKSFGKKAVVFGAGAYIGGKLAKKVSNTGFTFICKKQ